MSGQWTWNGPAKPVGGRPSNESSHSDDIQRLPSLPVDVMMNVLDHLSPTGSLTSYGSTAMRPDLSHDFLQWRISLANFILASRLFYQVGTPYLYRTILLADQKEVLRFFRTMTMIPDRRHMVRSLAWLTVLSTDDINIQSTMLRQSQVDSISADCWDSIKEKWPRQSTDYHVADIMNVVDSSSLEAWRLLGAIVGLCPKIKTLFMLHGSGKLIVPPDWPPNAELEVFTIEAHEDPPSQINAEFIIFLMLMNSPMLSRIEIKGPVLLEGMWSGFQRHPERRVVAENVKELVLLQATHPQDEMLSIVTAFPGLVSLQAEYDDASTRPALMPISDNISTALLRLADTLEVLSLTTAPTTHNHWLHINGHPPCLTSLAQMHKLKDFTTETMWIFGRDDLSIALQLPNLLPSSLVRFQLIDYWGTMTTDKYADFYPEFPNH